jgi:predicted GNAT family N-acyltransferase
MTSMITMDMLRIIIPETEEELVKYYDLRYEVLRKPWDQPRSATRDEWEDRSIHFLVLDPDEEAVATGRLQINSKEEGQIRSMAVKEAFRSRGIGRILIEKIEETARERKLTSIILDAREGAVNFYLRNCYEVLSESYLLFGKIRHFRMRKNL